MIKCATGSLHFELFMDSDFGCWQQKFFNFCAAHSTVNKQLKDSFFSDVQPSSDSIL